MKAEHEKLNFDKEEVQPMHKIALMTAVGEDLPFAIGKGLAPGEDYLKRALKENTPIVNSAIAWTNYAQKKVRKCLRDEWNDEKSPYGSSGVRFAQGKTQPGSAAMREITVTWTHMAA